MPEVVEPPVKPALEAPMTPVGDVYEQALKKLQGEEKPPATKPVEPEIKPEEKPVETEPPKKPTSALEAALSEPEKKEEPGKLEEFPEQLPNEGRKDHWAKARAGILHRDEVIGEHLKTITELRGEITKAKENPESRAELEQLRAKVAELTDGITAANIELLPEFRAKYIDGAKSLVTKAADKVKAYGGNPDLLREALSMPEGMRRDAAIEEAMGENANDMARNKVNSIVAQLDDLKEQAESERANAQQSFERLTQKQKEQIAAQATESEARKEQTFTQVTKLLQSQVPTLRLVDPSVDGADKWNADVMLPFEKAKELFSNGVSPEQTVIAAVKGSDYDRVAGLLQESWKENAQLKKQLAEFDSAQPDPKGGKAPVKTGKEESLEKTPGQIYAETMAALMNKED